MVCLLEKILPVRGGGTVQKRGHKLPNLHKRVKFEGRIKGFSAEVGKLYRGLFLKHFPWGKVAKTCQKFYIQSASFEFFAHFTKRYNSEDISIQEQELNTQTSCDRVGSGTELYIAHGGWGKFYRVSEYTFYIKQDYPVG